MKKIFITGGHLAPAKAVIPSLTGWEIYYLGRKHAMEDDKAEAFEYQEIKKLKNVRYLVLVAGRLQRKFFINVSQSIRALLKIPLGFIQAFWYILRFQPKVVLSFGGYVAVPVVISAWLLDIPVITHEQTTVSGIANTLISKFATKILVSWQSSLKHFPPGKTVLTGNPLRQEIIEVMKKKNSLNKPLKIYVTGGNQGSHVINQAIYAVLSDLVKKYQIIHQTGDAQTFQDFKKLSKKRELLPKKLQWRYQPYKFLDGAESAAVLKSADLIVSRAGANSVMEIAALEKPALLIPIPWSTGNEQEENAKLLTKIWMAEILSQGQLTGPTLLTKIDSMMTHINEYKKCAKVGTKLVHLDAATKIVKEVNLLTI